MGLPYLFRDWPLTPCTRFPRDLRDEGIFGTSSRPYEQSMQSLVAQRTVGRPARGDTWTHLQAVNALFVLLAVC